MQKRIDIQTRGFAEIFNKYALQFVLDWHKPMRVHKGWIHQIEIVAACPGYWRNIWRHEFADYYSDDPDLAAALLNFLRKQWSKLENSPSGKLKKFLSQNTVAKWDESFAARAAVEVADTIRKIISLKAPKPFIGARAVTKKDERFILFSQQIWATRMHRSGVVPDQFGNVCLWGLQDGEIAIAFAKLPGGKSVSPGQVRKAREWVVANQLASREFAEKVLDTNGFLHVKGKPCRRR